MKASIHPRYKPVVVTCVGCGTKVETRSTKGKDFSIDAISYINGLSQEKTQKFLGDLTIIKRIYVSNKLLNLVAK